MANRTTPSLVASIVKVDVADWPDITPFIDTAHSLVEQVCAVVPTYTTERLELIERWLSAYFFKVSDLQVISENDGTAGERRAIKIDFFFSQNTFGQTALLLDTAGGLKKVEEGAKKPRLKAQVIYLGRSYDSPPLPPRPW